MTSLSPKLAALIGTFILFAPTPVLAKWVTMPASPNNTVMSVDSDSVKRIGQNASFLRRNFYAIPRPDGTTSSYVQQSLDCRTGKYKLHRMFGVNSDAQIVFEHTYEKNEGIGNTPQSGSPGAAIRKYVCSR